MLPLDRTPVWTLARRRRFLASFHEDLRRYFATVGYEAFPFRVVENAEAMEIRRSLEARAPRCRRILAAADSVPMVRHGSGEGLGTVTRVNLVDAAFDLDRFDLGRDDLLRLFEDAEATHAREVRAAWLRMANPLYWVDMGLSVAEVIPFLPLRLLRRDPGRAARTAPGAALRGLARILALAGLGWGLLVILGVSDEAAALSGALFAKFVGLVEAGSSR